MWGGFPGGPLLVTSTFCGRYGAAFVDRGAFVFQTPLTAATNGAFVLGTDLEYVLDDTRLQMYSSGTWSTVGGESSSTLLAVWADSQTVIAAGLNQTVTVGPGSGPLTALSGVPAGDYEAVWAFGPSDIWLGNTAGQLVHYDGSKWQVYATAGSGDLHGDILQLWGASGTLYFSTPRLFGRWNGSNVETLLQAPADADVPPVYEFGRFWGRSANEVFIPLWDSRYVGYACGNAFVLWFDGTQFHQF